MGVKRPARPHCTRFVFSPDRAKRGARASRGDFACAAGAQEGEHLRFSPSCESSPFPQARRGRGKALSRQAGSTHLLLRQAWDGCHPRGVGISLLAASEKRAAETWAGRPLRASAHPYLRQQMPQIFGQMLNCLLSLRRKRGENLVSPLFASRSERACEQPPAGRLLASRSAPAARRRTVPAARRRRNPQPAWNGHAVSPCRAKKSTA